MKLINTLVVGSLLSTSIYANSFFENDLEKEFQRIHSLFNSVMQHPKYISVRDNFFTHTNASVNIYEKDKAFYIEYQLPGIQKEDIELKLHHNNILSLKVEQKNQKEEKDKEYHKKEISYNYISRDIQLPEYVDANKMDVEYKAGILKVKIPIVKPKQPKAKLINIK